jgi:hypothetical protein
MKIHGQLHILSLGKMTPSPSERRIMGTRAGLGEKYLSLAGNGTQNGTHNL